MPEKEKRTGEIIEAINDWKCPQINVRHLTADLGRSAEILRTTPRRINVKRKKKLYWGKSYLNFRKSKIMKKSWTKLEGEKNLRNKENYVQFLLETMQARREWSQILKVLWKKKQTTKTWKQPRYLSVGKWVNKLCIFRQWSMIHW